MPRVTTTPSAKAWRNRAGRVSRFLSSSVWSNSPSSTSRPRSPPPLRPTVDHYLPPRNLRFPRHPILEPRRRLQTARERPAAVVQRASGGALGCSRDGERDLRARLDDRRGEHLRVVAHRRIEVAAGDLPVRGLEVELDLLDGARVDRHGARLLSSTRRACQVVRVRRCRQAPRADPWIQSNSGRSQPMTRRMTSRLIRTAAVLASFLVGVPAAGAAIAYSGFSPEQQAMLQADVAKGAFPLDRAIDATVVPD